MRYFPSLFFIFFRGSLSSRDMCLAPSHCCCLSTVITNAAAASPPPPSFSLLLSFVLCYQFQIFRQPLAFFPTPCHSQGKTPLVFFSPCNCFDFFRETFIVFYVYVFQGAILFLNFVDLVFRPQSIGSLDHRATNLVSRSISAYMGQDRGNCQYRDHHQILLVG